MSRTISRLVARGSGVGFRLLPFATIQRASQIGLLAPVYHLVADAAPPVVRHLFAVRSTRRFEADLEFFLRVGNPVTLEQVRDAARGGQRLPRRAVFLSFDDGMREVAEVIAPLLLKRGIPATFFLNSAFVDNRALFYRHKASLLCEKVEQTPVERLKSLAGALMELGTDAANAQALKQSILSIEYAQQARLDWVARLLEVDFAAVLREKRPYLDSSQISGLLHAGFTIGAHSVDHPPYATLELQEQLRQTRESIAFLAERFGIASRDLAFPFVSDGVSADFYDAVYRTSEVELLFCLGGIAKEHPRNIERFWMERDATTPAETIVRRFCFNRRQSRGRSTARVS